MILSTPKPTREERASMTRDELLRSVWLLDDVIESLRWISVDERSPRDNATYYLVTTTRSPRVEMAWYLNGDWFWNNSDSQMGGVLAWMPLPELYRN